MTEQSPRDVLLKIRKLAQLPDEARHSRFAVFPSHAGHRPQEPVPATRRGKPFRDLPGPTHTAEGRGGVEATGHLTKEEWVRHREMIIRAVAAMENYLAQPSEKGRSGLHTLLHELEGEQNEHRRIKWGSVRVIKNRDLLLVEYALQTVLANEPSIPQWAYQTARHYAERYDSSHGTGLTPASVPLVQDIADYWMQEFGLSAESINTPAKARKPKKEKSPSRPDQQKVQFTHRQGQFLAFIHLYRRLNRQGPAELDMVRYFRVTPPAVHGMVVKLEQLGLVTREPGVARSIRVAIPESEIPALEEGPSR